MLIKKIILITMTLVLLTATGKMVTMLPFFEKKSVVVDMNLKKMTVDELKKYDGTDPSRPIYLAYEGNIYDVTGGKEFYQKGGVYHFLAGKDSTSELNFAGGGIIKRKYPIIARLVP